MSVCDHDKYCPGYGTAHEAGLTEDEAKALGMKRGQDYSRLGVKRLLRLKRKEIRGCTD